ncbi:acyl carrier protein [Gilliamella apicola]|uniref:acyl carrier protein n=1 Tax=Gilliamella apicola TaxID=1196095 RepID=UPI002FEE08C9
MELFDFIVEQISELTDVNSEEITRETPLAELDLVSLDYVSIEVALKKKYGVPINMENLGQKNINTLGDFIDYVSQALKN